MSELAFDASGEPIAFPATAEELRVRRFRNPGMRGACEVVHDREGAPLYIPIDSSYLELRSLVDGAPGRYRLDPVDAARRVIANSEAAYVTIAETSRPTGSAGSGEDRDAVIRELARANADMAKTIAERFANVMQSAADLLRAADGAGLPRRAPTPTPPPPPPCDHGDEPDDDEEDEDELEPAGPDIAALINQFMPLLQMWAARKVSSAPATPAAAPPPEPAPVPAPSPEVAPAPAGDGGVADGATTERAAKSEPVRNAAMPGPAETAHLLAIHAKLTLEEQRVAQRAVMKMGPELRASWMGELAGLTVDEAVTRIRSMIPSEGES